jgi:hypothetical protein
MTGSVTTIAGSLSGTSGLANGLGTNAAFSSPNRISITSTGQLYVPDANKLLRMLDTKG